MSASERWKKKKSGAIEDLTGEDQQGEHAEAHGLADSIHQIRHHGGVRGDLRVHPPQPGEGEEDGRGQDGHSRGGRGRRRRTRHVADSLDDTTTKGAKDDKPEIKLPMGPAMAPEMEPTLWSRQWSCGQQQPVVDLDAAVMWEFKWKNEEGSEVHGPHDSLKMLEWSRTSRTGLVQEGRRGAVNFITNGLIFDLYT